MKTLDELLMEYNTDIVLFRVEDEDGKAFLKWAKDNGCTWINNKEIDVIKDYWGYHMGIGKDRTIGYIMTMIWSLEKEKPKLKFKSILTPEDV